MSMEGLSPDLMRQKNTAVILKSESFKTHGIGEKAVLEFLETASGRLFKFRLAEADPSVSASELDRRAIAQLTSGRELPRIETIGIDESLVKIVPAGTSPSAHSPFWTKEAELDAAMNGGKNLSEVADRNLRQCSGRCIKMISAGTPRQLFFFTTKDA